MPHRFLIAPDPDRPGAFYAEHLVTGERFPVPGPRTAADALRSMVDPYIPLSIPTTTMMVVEHPASDHTVSSVDGAVCLEPGCLTPAALYCSDHRHQMQDSDF